MYMLNCRSKPCKQNRAFVGRFGKYFEDFDIRLSCFKIDLDGVCSLTAEELF